MTDLSLEPLSSHLAASLVRQYERMRGRVAAIVEPLSEDDLWRNPYGYGNSIGHLLLHLTGNLNYYIGARIAQTGYVRNRPLEFTDTSKRPKAEVLANFHSAVDLARRTIEAQGPQDWMAPFEAVGADDKDRLGIFIRCGAHLDHHMAQMIYLSRELAKRD